MMIVIGENTREAVREHFELRSLGKAMLKGKEKGVEAYEVVAPLRADERAVAPDAASREA